MLEGMPSPHDLHAEQVEGQVLVAVGSTVLFRYDADDAGLRNVAAVTLPEMGFTARRVAQVLGITEVYVSMLRRQAREEGSSALMRRRGRPKSLSAKAVARARAWRAEGLDDTVIGERLGVHATTVGRALTGVPRADPADVAVEQPVPRAASADVAAVQPVLPVPLEDVESQAGSLDPGPPAPEAAGSAGSARIGAGRYPCRYAGVMLLHAYLNRVDAEAVFATLTGGPARRYDDYAILSTATVGFALGAGTIEGVKHLRRGQAGPALGVAAIPELATLRTRLAALADAADPLAVQRAFAARMLAVDPAGDPVYFVDDHFVPYAGARPVGKGWNTKRRHAEAGRDDTLLVDARGRAVVFGSGEPTGLSSTLPGVLAQLRAVIGPHAPVLLGFDRGGAYPAVFTACRDAGADWVTYRRAPLAATSVTPKRSWTIRDGKRVSMLLADERVQLKDYGDARQLTLYEHDQVVLQVLTSDTTGTGADLLCWLRSRWRIENMFKYASEHNGIDALADYRMDIGPDTRKVTNPARVAARKTVKDAEAQLAAAERALPQLLNGGGTPRQLNAALPGAHARIRDAQAALQAAKDALKPIPAKIAATELDPDAKRARPVLARRGLQMVLRLLAFNAEAWLAEHLNAYLADPDEYRAITRNLLHHGGQIEYTNTGITITLDRPDSPRIARALALLTDELNTTRARLPGDRRPITYQVAAAPDVSTKAPRLLREV